MSFRGGRYNARKKLEKKLLEQRVAGAIMASVGGSVYISPGSKVAVAASVAAQPRPAEKPSLLSRILSSVGLG